MSQFIKLLICFVVGIHAVARAQIDSNEYFIPSYQGGGITREGSCEICGMVVTYTEQCGAVDFNNGTAAIDASVLQSDTTGMLSVDFIIDDTQLVSAGDGSVGWVKVIENEMQINEERPLVWSHELRTCDVCYNKFNSAWRDKFKELLKQLKQEAITQQADRIKEVKRFKMKRKLDDTIEKINKLTDEFNQVREELDNEYD